MRSRQAAPMLPSRKRQIFVPPVAAAGSSSSASNAAPLHTTGLPRQRKRSGLTPHDPITADQRALADSFVLLHRQPCLDLHSPSPFAHSCSRHHIAQPTVLSFASASSIP